MTNHTERYTWVATTSADKMEAEEVKAARKALGLNQADFGEAICNMSQPNVSRAENETGLQGCHAKIVRLLLDAQEGEG